MRFYINKNTFNVLRKSIDDNKLNMYKKKLLAILDKKEDEEKKELKKSFYEFIEKAGGLPPGTKKEWPAGSGKWYVKTGQGKWIRTYSNSGTRGAKQSIAYMRKKIQNAESLEELLKIVQENKDKFTDDQGKPIDIVKDLMKDVHGKHQTFKNAAAGAKKDAEKVMNSSKNTVTDSQKTEKVISDYMGDKKDSGDRIREGNKEIVFGNDYTKKHKLEFKVHMSGAFLGKPKMDQALFDELSQYNQGADTVELSKKYGIDGAEVLGLISKVNEGRVDIVGGDKESETEKNDIKSQEPEETEEEKHQNRSDAMKGNKNAYKGGPKEEEFVVKMKLDFNEGHYSKQNENADYDQIKTALLDTVDNYIPKLNASQKKQVEELTNKLKTISDSELQEMKKEADKRNSFIKDMINKLYPQLVEKWKSGKRLAPQDYIRNDQRGLARKQSALLKEVIDHLSDKQKNLIISANIFSGSVNKEIKSRKENTTKKQTFADIKKNYQNAKSVQGNSKTIHVGSEKIKCHYKLVEAETPIASHDENTFQKTEGFPTNNGGTINDRDYENDNAAKEGVMRIAGDYDGRALESPPIVTKDGIVVSGNNRTMSSKLAAKNGTDKEYINELKDVIGDYGISEEELSKFKNPRIILEIDKEHEGEYTTEEFAKYNKTDQKTKSVTEKAVEISKTIKPEAISNLAEHISQFDTLGELYTNKKAAGEFVDSLVINGIIGKNEIAQYYTEQGGLSDGGKEFIETTLVGGIMNENNIRSLAGAGGASIRQKLVRAIVPLIDNKGIGKEYTFNDELNKAVAITVEVMQNRDKFKKVEDYLDQGNLFGEEVDPLTGKLAIMLHDNTQKEFAEKMREVQGGLRPAANGEFDLFLGSCESRDSVLDRILDISNKVSKALDYVFGLFR